MKKIVIAGLLVSSIGLYACANFDRAPERVVTFQEVVDDVVEQAARSSGYDGGAYVADGIPFLNANSTYEVGSVFIADWYPIRYTENCVVPASMVDDEPKSITIKDSDNRSFSLSANLPETLKKAIGQIADFDVGVGANSSAIFELELTGSKTVTSIKSLTDHLQDSDNCLADIAGKEAMVLIRVEYGKAKVNGGNSLSANATVKILEEDSIGVKYNDGDDQGRSFEVYDTESQARIWIFASIDAAVTGVESSMTFEERLAAIKEARRQTPPPISVGQVTPGSVATRTFVTVE